MATKRTAFLSSLFVAPVVVDQLEFSYAPTCQIHNRFDGSRTRLAVFTKNRLWMPRPTGRGGKRPAAGGSTDLVTWR